MRVGSCVCARACVCMRWHNIWTIVKAYITNLCVQLFWNKKLMHSQIFPFCSTFFRDPDKKQRDIAFYILKLHSFPDFYSFHLEIPRFLCVLPSLFSYSQIAENFMHKTLDAGSHIIRDSKSVRGEEERKSLHRILIKKSQGKPEVAKMPKILNSVIVQKKKRRRN